MTKLESTVCERLGISEAEYSATKRARRVGVSLNALAHPGRGRQVIDEKSAKLSDSGDLPDTGDDSIKPEELVAKAQQDLEQYLDDPDDENAWGLLASAGAYIESALERCAPAFADRADELEPPYTGSGADEAAESGRGLRSPFTSHRSEPGSRTVRVVENGHARIERLSAAEVAVCSRLGLRHEDYAAERTHRRVAIG